MCARLVIRLYRDTIPTGPDIVDIDHEIFSTLILSLLLIQEGQLSVSDERMCTSTDKPPRGVIKPP